MDEAPVAEEAVGTGVTQAAGKAGAGGVVGEVSSGFAEGNKAGEGPVSPIDLEDVDLDDLYTGTPPAPSHWTTEHLCNYWKRPLVQSLWLLLIGVVLLDIMVAMDYWGGEHALTLLRVSYWLCLVGLIFNALGTANFLRMLPDMMQDFQDLTAKGFVWVEELEKGGGTMFPCRHRVHVHRGLIRPRGDDHPHCDAGGRQHLRQDEHIPDVDGRRLPDLVGFVLVFRRCDSVGVVLDYLSVAAGREAHVLQDEVLAGEGVLVAGDFRRHLLPRVALLYTVYY